MRLSSTVCVEVFTILHVSDIDDHMVEVYPPMRREDNSIEYDIVFVSTINDWRWNLFR